MLKINARNKGDVDAQIKLTVTSLRGLRGIFVSFRGSPLRSMLTTV